MLERIVSFICPGLWSDRMAQTGVFYSPLVTDFMGRSISPTLSSRLGGLGYDSARLLQALRVAVTRKGTGCCL